MEIKQPENTVILKRSTDIINLLGTKKKASTLLYLWQQQSSGEKEVFQARLIDVKASEKTIDFFPKDQETLFKFIGSKCLYILSQNKFFLFKCKIVTNSNFKVTVKLPDEVICSEDRIDPRIKIDELIEKYFSFNILQEDKYKLLRKRLIDVSDNGLAFKNYKSDAQSINLGDKIKLNYLDAASLTQKVEGEVVYKKMLIDEIAYAQYYRIGIKFNEPIDSKEFYTFLNTSR